MVTPEEIDADIGNRFMQELKPPGLLSDAQQFGQVFAVVGIDIDTESFPIVRAIAEQQQLKHVHFTQADLLAGDFASLGVFDTVTALHILEHFNVFDTYRVLTNLLQITSQRLVLAVPKVNSGTILTNAQGKTLHYLTADSATQSAFSSNCAQMRRRIDEWWLRVLEQGLPLLPPRDKRANL